MVGVEKFGLDTDKTIYTGPIALVVNIAVCIVGTWIAQRMGATRGPDETRPGDYFVDADQPRPAALVPSA